MTPRVKPEEHEGINLGFEKFRSPKNLSHVEDVDFEEKKWILPTWVPDWTSSKVSMEAKLHLQKVKIPNGIHDMKDIHVVLGEKAVLGCIGTRVDFVERVKNEIPRREDVFALCHKITNLRAMRGSRKNAYFADNKMEVRLVCECFCAWFNTPETSPYHLFSKDREKVFDHNYLRAKDKFLDRMEQLISKIANPADLEPLENYAEVLHKQEGPELDFN
ncbi:hypothetical protein BHYA_0042g00320 [Botrytis hyacinthi]|uniref:Uncharacterized protein n=1 Tax=Botrytis hyacinthi TaxID=278943 RepID=A0A4Z1GWL2_9HELO|nr:hypothetical protein BHYA_0042g00320 [Botrytis hyacinthi]